MVGALIAGALNPFEVGALYFVVTGVAGLGAIMQARRQGSYDAWQPRTMFFLPFFFIFLAPAWLACEAFANGWMEKSPSTRYISIASGFLITIPVLLFYFRLVGLMKKKPNKAPEPTSTRTP
jgi:hypothetical protein